MSEPKKDDPLEWLWFIGVIILSPLIFVLYVVWLPASAIAGKLFLGADWSQNFTDRYPGIAIICWIGLSLAIIAIFIVMLSPS